MKSCAAFILYRNMSAVEPEFISLMSQIDGERNCLSTFIINLDHDWKFQLNQNGKLVSSDAQQWESVDLPHNPKTQMNVTNQFYLYYKQFRIEHEQPKHIYINFDNSYSTNRILAQICLNSKKLFHGYLPCSVEIPKEHAQQTNEIELYTTDAYLNMHVSICVLVDDNKSPRTMLQGKIFDHGIFDYSASLLDEQEYFHLSINNYDDGLPYFKYSTSQKKQFHGDHRVVPRLNICMLVVGSRGDVQPYCAFAKELMKYGHRVRLATHEEFRSLIRKNGVEFYPLSGNSADLMSFMVKNSGIFPSFSSIINGDLKRNTDHVHDIVHSCWQACTENDDETNRPFRAEAIIANPPSYGHIHCAEKLSIPLHICFTFPWTPTTSFPQPLCSVLYQQSTQFEKVNYLSYGVIERLIWMGIGKHINKFRTEVLGLRPLPANEASQILVTQNVPHIYCWSPSIVPKPDDWPEHVDVSGYFFFDSSLVENYKPSRHLVQFINDCGQTPIFYIGFGSITGHDSKHMLEVIVGALDRGGYRAILPKDWKGLDGKSPSENIFLVDDCPHEWLFKHVTAVCHHGGCGTTAAGLRLGKPTIIVPFFGDQFFWGTTVAKLGAGPLPITGKNLTTDELCDAFSFVLKDETRIAAERIASQISNENGVQRALELFHHNLPVDDLISAIEPTYPACYFLKRYNLKISRPVAQVLITNGQLKETDIKIYHTKIWNITNDDDDHSEDNILIKNNNDSETVLMLGDNNLGTPVDSKQQRDPWVLKLVRLVVGRIIKVLKSLFCRRTSVRSSETDPLKSTIEEVNELSQCQMDFAVNDYYTSDVCNDIIFKFNQINQQYN
ncbi:unnamed protein product, partial [Didymodactylos carnosus]